MARSGVAALRMAGPDRSAPCLSTVAGPLRPLSRARFKGVAMTDDFEPAVPSPLVLSGKRRLNRRQNGPDFGSGNPLNLRGRQPLRSRGANIGTCRGAKVCINRSRMPELASRRALGMLRAQAAGDAPP